MHATLRLAVPADAAGCLAIYAPFVQESHTTFETEVPSLEQFTSRMDTVMRTHPWIVAVVDDRVVGYAYASPFKDRRAYQWTAEVSVYVSPDARRQGLGRSLYEGLLRCLRALGFVGAVGLIAQPNPASVALHEGLGFERVAWFPQVGFKRGRWHDVGWWRLALGDAPADPAPPHPLASCREELARLLAPQSSS